MAVTQYTSPFHGRARGDYGYGNKGTVDKIHRRECGGAPIQSFEQQLLSWTDGLPTEFVSCQNMKSICDSSPNCLLARMRITQISGRPRISLNYKENWRTQHNSNV